MTQVISVSGVLVHAPLQTVFDYISDLTKHPEWSGGELKIEEASSGPVTVGKEYASKGEIPMQKDRPNQLQVTEYEPPVKFGFTAQDANFGLVHHLFTFNEQDGGVQVQRAVTISLNPFMAFVFRFVIYPFIGKPMMDKAYTKLKMNLE
ncbi:MAG TPA: SRPBCC family protein [Anaerolineales bacterium]|nr:SRPBCC family protein [Anaerolineales bacterium]